MTGKGKTVAAHSFEGCVAEWTSREMQLTRLHEEIISRREALLNCSVAYHQSQEQRVRHDASTSEQAYIRNQRLLQDMRSTQERIFNDMSTSPTPRFMTLQKNYWAMVKSQLPMWEQDLGIKRSNVRGQSQSSESRGQSAHPRQKATKKQQRQNRRSRSPK